MNERENAGFYYDVLPAYEEYQRLLRWRAQEALAWAGARSRATAETPKEGPRMCLPGEE